MVGGVVAGIGDGSWEIVVRKQGRLRYPVAHIIIRIVNPVRDRRLIGEVGQARGGIVPVLDYDAIRESQVGPAS